MKHCLDEGTLRAYLDGELPDAEACRVEANLTSCAECRGRRERMEKTLRGVHALLDVLSPEDAAVLHMSRPARRWVPGTLGAAMAAAVALLLAGGTPAPRPRTAQMPQPAADAPVQGFIGLAGADPIQIGMVVRVMVPVSDPAPDGTVQEIAADVVIGEDGQARAIRFVE
ncbi:MAG TPA: hypothetical protein VMI94_04495 [Bryobacteraceae bacterium]|nr:hypothetical protein [Bryobacteraceae bacterium]